MLNSNHGIIDWVDVPLSMYRNGIINNAIEDGWLDTFHDTETYMLLEEVECE